MYETKTTKTMKKKKKKRKNRVRTKTIPELSMYILKCSRSSIKYFFFRCFLCFSLLCNFPLSFSGCFFSFFFSLPLATHIVSLFRRRVFGWTVHEIHIFNVAFTRVYCVVCRQENFILLLSVHSFCAVNENDIKKPFTRTWFKCSVSLPFCVYVCIPNIFVCLRCYYCDCTVNAEKKICIETECKH